MRLLAFDGALEYTGWCLWEDGGPLAVGLIHTSSKLAHSERLAAIHQEAGDLMRAHRPQAVYVEDQYLGRSVATFKTLCAVRGAIEAACGECGVPCREITPAAVKKTATGNGSATKDEVRQAVVRDLPPSVKQTIRRYRKQDDLYDAVAIAKTGAAQEEAVT